MCKKILVLIVGFFLFGIIAAKADCTKDEIYSYIKEGLSKDQISMICGSSSVSGNADQDCCCFIFVEREVRKRTYGGGGGKQNSSTWTAISQDRQVMPANQCGETDFLNDYTRQRTYCTSMSDCLGR